MQDSSAFQFLAIDTIHESSTNPRKTFDETKLYELAESASALANHASVRSERPSRPVNDARTLGPCSATSLADEDK